MVKLFQHDEKPDKEFSNVYKSIAEAAAEASKPKSTVVTKDAPTLEKMVENKFHIITSTAPGLQIKINGKAYSIALTAI